MELPTELPHVSLAVPQANPNLLTSQISLWDPVLVCKRHVQVKGCHYPSKEHLSVQGGPD